MSYPLQRRRRGSGFWIQGHAGEELGSKKLVYLDSSGSWKLTDSEVAAEMPVLGITMERIPSGQAGSILRYGYVGRADWTWTIGGAIYASATSGELTQTQPPMASQAVQIIGYPEARNLIFFNPHIGRGTIISPTYTQRLHVGIGTFKIPAAGAPDVFVQDNTVMLSFNPNGTEDSYISWEIPPDYAGGDLEVLLHWTNDGGVDDNGKNIRLQLNYQSMVNTTVVSGNHANSPKTINDTYTSASGWIFHTTDAATIAAADFSTQHQINFRLTAIAAAVTQMTGEVHILAMMLQYSAYSDL